MACLNRSADCEREGALEYCLGSLDIDDISKYSIDNLNMGARDGFERAGTHGTNLVVEIPMLMMITKEHWDTLQRDLPSRPKTTGRSIRVTELGESTSCRTEVSRVSDRAIERVLRHIRILGGFGRDLGDTNIVRYSVSTR